MYKDKNIYNEFMEVLLYDKHRIRSYIKYRLLLYKIKRSVPDYNTLCNIYDFLDKLNYAYFHCINAIDRLFIGDSRNTRSNKIHNKSLIYKDDNVKILFILKEDDIITLHIERHMGYTSTSITFKNGEVKLKNKLEEQLFINCTNLLMNELYRIIKKYRRFGRINNGF